MTSSSYNNETYQYKTTKYANEIYPLSTDEYQELKQSIKERGLYHPITINQDGDVLDGHHRLKACEELGIRPEFEVKQFADKLQEELFVIDTNVVRRQLNDYQRGELLLSKKKPILEKIAKQNMSLAGKGDKVLAPLGRIHEKLAEEPDKNEQEKIRRSHHLQTYDTHDNMKDYIDRYSYEAIKREFEPTNENEKGVGNRTNSEAAWRWWAIQWWLTVRLEHADKISQIATEELAIKVIDLVTEAEHWEIFKRSIDEDEGRMKEAGLLE